ncbi:TadE family protein [Rugamonas apoptosis]|uniref:Pilus assembly protein n=1 Tax=Rugamonas apoptosis TaxID=2758570 RepID=A0A7W2FDV1_9BURK|nr:TadE family protein [Rugamonas apoptosis]MBA5689804.1 pilus assembly protein [Rugamonas apoptosis]
MWAFESSPARRRQPGTARQTGVAAVEFALVAILFFMLLFFTIDLSRAIYMWNTLREVSRRAATAAANTDVADQAAKDLLRQNAVFRTTPGPLAWGAPVTDQHIRIDYFSLARDANGAQTLQAIPTANLPACPARNRLNCETDQNAGNCVRFVRVRLCATGTDESSCDPIPYRSLTSLYSFSVNLPTATMVVKAETLGYQPGMALCP